MDKPMPADLQAERAALGSVFLDRDALAAVEAWLLTEHFYLERHAWVYAAQKACYDRREPPDYISVCAELQKHNRLEAIGGPAYLVELANSVPTALHIEYYAKIVVRMATLRGLVQAGGKIAEIGYNSTDDIESAITAAEAQIEAVSLERPKGEYYSAGQIIDALWIAFEQQRDTGKASGLSTGYRDLDHLTGGLQPSDFIILAARPAVGKSSLALGIAINAAHQTHLSVAFFSLEMSRLQLMQRALATYTGIDMQKLRTGDIRESDFRMLFQAMGELHELPLYINDTPGITIAGVRSYCRQIQAAHGLDLVVIDYLQLMQGRRSENRVQEVSDISRGLKALARDFNVPVIALSQLSRAVEGRTSHVPMLSDLRESGSLEQDADLVWFIYREELYEPDTDKKGIAEIHFAKHRNGPTGIVPMRFFSSTTKFADLERYRAIEGYEGDKEEHHGVLSPA